MIKKYIPALVILMAGCSSTAPPIDPAPKPAVFSFGDIETAADGRCFGVTRGADTFQTVVEQVEVVPETRTSNGTVINPAIFRNETRRVRIPSTETQRFETICPPTYTQDFVSSLQRALQARGAYGGPINGQLDDATSNAIQLFQLGAGTNSPLLTVETARTLGLITVDVTKK